MDENGCGLGIPPQSVGRYRNDISGIGQSGQHHDLGPFETKEFLHEECRITRTEELDRQDGVRETAITCARRNPKEGRNVSDNDVTGASDTPQDSGAQKYADNGWVLVSHKGRGKQRDSQLKGQGDPERTEERSVTSPHG